MRSKPRIVFVLFKDVSVVLAVMAVILLASGALIAYSYSKRTGLGGIGIAWYDRENGVWRTKVIYLDERSVLPQHSVSFLAGTNQRADAIFAWAKYGVARDIGEFQGAYCILARKARDEPGVMVDDFPDKGYSVGRIAGAKPVNPAYFYYEDLVANSPVSDIAGEPYPTYWDFGKIPMAQGKSFKGARVEGEEPQPYKTFQIFPYSVSINGTWLTYNGMGGIFLPLHDGFDHIRHSESPGVDHNEHNLENWIEATMGEEAEGNVYEIWLVFGYFSKDVVPKATYWADSKETIARPIFAASRLAIAYVKDSKAPPPFGPPQPPGGDCIIRLEFPIRRSSILEVGGGAVVNPLAFIGWVLIAIAVIIKVWEVLR